MNSTIPKTHLFTPEDLHLFELGQIFTASSVWFEKGLDKQEATFDLVIRDMPKNRNFLVFAGLEEIIEGIKKWKYTEEEINYLLKSEVISEKFTKYLANFKFTGSISAMPEGTIFFPKEPVIRVTAPIIEANLITMFLINSVVSNTIFTTKVIRSVIAASPKPVITGGLRAHSFESSIKYSRACAIVGAFGFSTPSSMKKYRIPPTPPRIISAYHAAIKSFPSEIEAMETFAALYPRKINLMVDTYDFDQGLENAIKVAEKFSKDGKPGIYGITIDSGDLISLTKKARKVLDEHGLKDVKITVASNMNENKIMEFKQKKIPADSFLAVTDLITVSDDPKLEVVYKMSELKSDGKLIYCAKFSPGKESYPGKKQVFRIYKDKKFDKDVIGLEDEKLGDPLLVEIVKNGKLIYKLPNLEEIKGHVNSQMDILPEKLKDITEEHEYKVEISNNLKELFEKVKKIHKS